MAYRFPSVAAEKVVREIWMEIVEGRSDLWQGIGEDKKECIRGGPSLVVMVAQLRRVNASLSRTLPDALPEKGT
jgi:hypothetical protein